MNDNSINECEVVMNNQYKFNPKRVKDNSNLYLHYGHFYKGLPVQVSRGPLVENWLERLRLVILDHLQCYRRTFALRIDLRLPVTYRLPEGQVFGNDYAHHFKRYLKRSLDKQVRLKRASGERVHEHGLKLIVAREYESEGEKPHFHLLLLFNGNAYTSMGRMKLECDNLFVRICEAWANVLGLHPFECKGLVQFARDYQFRVDFGDQNGLEGLFLAASYLAKQATKNFSDGNHPFLCSRIRC